MLNEQEWVGAPVDPNDPRNTNVVHLMRRNVVDLRDGLAFSTEPHELLLLVSPYSALAYIFHFYSFMQEGFYPGRRHQLLKQRNDHLIRAVPIPLDEAEITEEDFPIVQLQVNLHLSSHILPNLSAHLLLHKDTKLFEEGESDKALFLSANGMYLRDTKLKLALARLDEDKERGPRVHDVVVLPAVAHTNFGELFRDLFRPRRKLNPQRKERKVWSFGLSPLLTFVVVYSYL